MTNYPPADTKAAWFQDDYPGATITPNRGVLHTTEGTDWPDYDGGAKAPHYTAKPRFGPAGTYLGLDFRAHFPDEKSSRALVNAPGGVETNTEDAIQIELVGTCDAATHNAWHNTAHIFWPAAPQAALEDLSEFIAWQHTAHGIVVHGPSVGWMAYPASYGPSGVRMTGPQWDRFTGWCGHQHVPENVHGDPGNFPWVTVEQLTNALLDDDGGSNPAKVSVSALQAAFRQFLKDGPRPQGARPYVRRLRQALNLAHVNAGGHVAHFIPLNGKVDDVLVATWTVWEAEHGGKGRDTVPDTLSLRSLTELVGPRYQVVN